MRTNDNNILESIIGILTNIDLNKAKYLCSLPKVLGQHPDNGKDITINSGRFGPYLKCENKSARLENVDELFIFSEFAKTQPSWLEFGQDKIPPVDGLIPELNLT